MFLHLSDCHIATEINAKPVCVYVCVSRESKQLYTSRMQYSTHHASPYLFKSPFWERSRKSESFGRHRKNFDVSWAHPAPLALLRHLQPAPNEREQLTGARGGSSKQPKVLRSSIHALHPCHGVLPTSCFYRIIRWFLNETFYLMNNVFRWYIINK